MKERHKRLEAELWIAIEDRCAMGEEAIELGGLAENREDMIALLSL